MLGGAAPRPRRRAGEQVQVVLAPMARVLIVGGVENEVAAYLVRRFG